VSQVSKVSQASKGFLPVFFVQVPCPRDGLTILTMLDHWGAQVAGARAATARACGTHSRAARAPC